jgi:hypothetical protein
MKENQIVNSMYTPDITYTYPGRLNLDLIEPIEIGVPAISDLMRVVQGIRCGEYLHYISALSTVLSKGTGDCNPTYTQAGSITDRQLTTGKFYVNLEWCEEEFSAICTALSDSDLVAPGVDGYELTNRLMNLIFRRVTATMQRDVLKALFFGDNSLGAGNTTIYSVIDGVFTHFLDSETAYCVQPVGPGFPNAHNSVLAADQARDQFRALWGQANLRLKQLPDAQKVFWVTGSVWENYYDSLINNCCVEGSWRLAQDGTTELRYRGIRVLPLWFADDSLQNDDTNPFYDEIRHFIVYTARDNHIFGVERASDLNNLTSCFDCRTNSNLIKAKMRFGYNFAQCDLIAWAR